MQPDEYIGLRSRLAYRKSVGSAGRSGDLFVLWRDGAGGGAVDDVTHSGISFFALALDQVPRFGYWKVRFEPYWQRVVANSRQPRTGS